MSKHQFVSLAVGLIALLLGIFSDQVAKGVVVIPDVWKPYVLGVVGFLLVTAIPAIWPRKAEPPA